MCRSCSVIIENNRLVCSFLFSRIQTGMVVSGMTNINLPALEKRFQLSSKDLGLIAASNDISGILLVSFVSFYGEFGNKIKWLGYGMLITGQFHWRMCYLRTGNINDQRMNLQGFISSNSPPPSFVSFVHTYPESSFESATFAFRIQKFPRLHVVYFKWNPPVHTHPTDLDLL